MSDDELTPEAREEAQRVTAQRPGNVRELRRRQLKNAVKERLFGRSDAPVRIGRFTVIKRLGEGGMGVVYSAYDDELERKIAIKLLRSDASSPGSRGRARLLREAQAMAKLSHPNVIPVFEVGTHEDNVYIAMEYVRGRTLTQWLEETEPGIAEVLDVFAQAGAALAAAHAAGLVHRDFKPDNVMVGDDGRIRVVDFGLARPPRDGSDPGTDPLPVPDPDTDAVPESRGVDGGDGKTALLNSPLTETGAILGTPAYMAPEQHLGEATDARSDQFSYCVALYESLYGERPFDGDTVKSLATSIVHGRVAPEPTGTAIPSWIRQVIVRGLSVDPVHRYPTMNDLLAALRDDPTIWRRRYGWGGAAAASLVAVLVGAGMLAGSQSTEGPACVPAESRLADVWSPARQATLTGRLGAENSALPKLSSYMDEWATRYGSTCAGLGDPDPARTALAARQVACLDDRLREVDALLTVWTAADGPEAGAATFAVRRLERLERCVDPRSVDAHVPLPADDASLLEATRIRARLAEADRVCMGEDPKRGIEDGIELAETVAERARAANLGSLEAEALLSVVHGSYKIGRLGDVIERAERAALAAEEVGDDHVFALAAVTAADFLSIGEFKKAEAERWLRRADAALARLGVDREVQVRLESAWGAFYAIQHKGEQAKEHLSRALVLAEEIHGKDARELARILNNLGVVERSMGNTAEAAVLYRRHLEIGEKTGGGPQMMYSYMALADLEVSDGRPEKGLELTRQALAALDEAELQPNHPLRALALASVGEMHLHLDHPRDALQFLQKAVEVAERNSFDIQLTHAYVSSSVALHDMGQDDDALDMINRVALQFEKQFSGDELAREAYYGQILAWHAVIASTVGRHEAAAASAKRALDILEATPEQEMSAEGRLYARYALAKTYDATDKLPERDQAIAQAVRELEKRREQDAKKPPKVRPACDQRILGEISGWLETHRARPNVATG